MTQHPNDPDHVSDHRKLSASVPEGDEAGGEAREGAEGPGETCNARFVPINGKSFCVAKGKAFRRC